jgi:hypothetical protein
MLDFIGWLLLIPLVGAFWLVLTFSGACARKGGLWRTLGILVSFSIGGTCIGAAVLWGPESGLVIFRRLAAVIGMLVATAGSWKAVTGSNEELELRVEMGRLEGQIRELDEGKKSQD